ncbi:MAG: hypothetical protein LBH06_04730 [Rikenellaceae bacterium]|jgi:hypothetical protein|nr:hypothetical protein [Rikenellaceae bacterium]
MFFYVFIVGIDWRYCRKIQAKRHLPRLPSTRGASVDGFPCGRTLQACQDSSYKVKEFFLNYAIAGGKKVKKYFRRAQREAGFLPLRQMRKASGLKITKKLKKSPKSFFYKKYSLFD